MADLQVSEIIKKMVAYNRIDTKASETTLNVRHHSFTMHDSFSETESDEDE